MSSLIIYLLKSNLIIVVLYGFYATVCHRMPWHTMNRFILLFIIIFSVICPVLEISFVLDQPLNQTNVWIEDFNDSFSLTSYAVQPVDKPNWFFWLTLLMIIYAIGVLFFFLRFLKQLLSIVKLFNDTTEINYGTYTLRVTTNNCTPFSFFHKIFVPHDFRDLSGIDTVISHERVHVRQWHSMDVLLLELVSIAFWFNPFIFHMRSTLKLVHEYLADRHVIKAGASLKEYLDLLVISAAPRYMAGLRNHFASIKLKKRIEMMTSNKRISRMLKISYLLFIPIVAVLLLAFSTVKLPQHISKDNTNLIETIKGSVKVGGGGTTPSIMPLKEEDNPRLTSPFGERLHPVYKTKRWHMGVDFAAPIGTPVIATADGRVVEITETPNKGYGLKVMIAHDEVYTTLYAQLSAFNTTQGDYVKQGEVIGYVGSSGLSTAPHLHYEIIKNGKRIDPQQFF